MILVIRINVYMYVAAVAGVHITGVLTWDRHRSGRFSFDAKELADWWGL